MKEENGENGKEVWRIKMVEREIVIIWDGEKRIKDIKEVGKEKWWRGWDREERRWNIGRRGFIEVERRWLRKERDIVVNRERREMKSRRKMEKKILIREIKSIMSKGGGNWENGLRGIEGIIEEGRRNIMGLIEMIENMSRWRRERRKKRRWR